MRGRAWRRHRYVHAPCAYHDVGHMLCTMPMHMLDAVAMHGAMQDACLKHAGGRAPLPRLGWPMQSMCAGMRPVSSPASSSVRLRCRFDVVPPMLDAVALNLFTVCSSVTAFAPPGTGSAFFVARVVILGSARRCTSRVVAPPMAPSGREVEHVDGLAVLFCTSICAHRAHGIAVVRSCTSAETVFPRADRQSANIGSQGGTRANDSWTLGR